MLREFCSVHPYNFKITIMEPQWELAAHWQHIGTDFRYIFRCTLVKLWEGWGSSLPFYLHSTSHFYSWQALNTSWLFLTCANWCLWNSSFIQIQNAWTFLLKNPWQENKCKFKCRNQLSSPFRFCQHTWISNGMRQDVPKQHEMCLTTSSELEF